MIETISSMKNVPLGRRKMPAVVMVLSVSWLSLSDRRREVRRYAVMLLAAKT